MRALKLPNATLRSLRWQSPGEPASAVLEAMSELELQSEEAGADAQKARVRAFWQADPCGTVTTEEEVGTPEFFDEVERRRYDLEPYIPVFADFAGSSGLEVLEIGTGLGTDTLQFARAGARISGVDLTPRSIELVRSRLERDGVSDRIGSLEVADAENLPFSDASFDRVYSWGVLHHTPNTQRSIDEALRVLRPGGTACVMLYGRDSFYAWKMWARHGLLRGRPFQSVAAVLSANVESVGTKAYTDAELRPMFAALDDLTITGVRTVYDESHLQPLARATRNRFGWFRVMQGTKP